MSAILDWLDRVPPVFSGEFHLLDLGSTKSADRRSDAARCPIASARSADIRCAAKKPRGWVWPWRSVSRVSVRAYAAGSNAAGTLDIAQELIGHSARPIAGARSRNSTIAPRRRSVMCRISLASALVDAALHAHDDVAWTLAASGFRDTSRLAASDVTMMLDILKSNRAEVLDGVGQRAAVAARNDRTDRA